MANQSQESVYAPFAIHFFGVTGTSARELNYAIAKASAADRDSIRNPDQFAIGKFNPRTGITVIKKNIEPFVSKSLVDGICDRQS